MNKATYALGIIMAGFILYLAMNDRLKVYAELLFGGGATASSSGAGSNPVTLGYSWGQAFRKWLGNLFGGSGTSN